MYYLTLVTAGYLHVMCASVLPSEANAPLVVYANAPLPFSVAAQTLKSVIGRNPQCFQRVRFRHA